MRRRSSSSAARGFVRPCSPTTAPVGQRCQSVRFRKLTKNIRRACSAWRTCHSWTRPLRSKSSQKRRTLVRQGFVRSLPHQESTHPAHAMRRRLLSYKPRPEQELAELLERRLDLTHGPPGPTSASIGMPSPRSHGKSLTSSRLSGPRHQYPPPGPVSHRQPEPWVDADPSKWRTQHNHGIPWLSRQRHFRRDGTSESSKPKYGLHLTDHWPPSQNPKHDIVSSAGPGRFAFSCLDLALAGYTTFARLR